MTTERGVLRQQRFTQGQVVWRVRNVGSVVIPAYGTMFLVEAKPPPNKSSGFLYGEIRMFTEEDAKLQNHARLLVAGRFPIQVGQLGMATSGPYALVLLGGPTLSSDEPTTNAHEPKQFDTVGPHKSSFEMYRGGVTHTLLSIRIVDKKRYGIIGPNTSPGANVVFPASTDGASNSIPGIAECTLLSRRVDGGTMEAKAGSGLTEKMILRCEHHGDKPLTGGRGQAKLTSGAWAIDVKYC